MVSEDAVAGGVASRFLLEVVGMDFDFLPVGLLDVIAIGARQWSGDFRGSRSGTTLSRFDPAICFANLLLVFLGAGVVGVDGEAAKLALLEGAETIKGGFEVVEDDGVGEAFEDEAQLPEGVDANW